MSSPPDPLDRWLDRWNPAVPEPTGLREEVWRRIDRAEETRGRFLQLTRLETRYARPAIGLLFVTACFLAVLFVREHRAALRQSALNAELARKYLGLIDPMGADPGQVDSLDRELAWLRDTLHLSPDQFARIREFHEASGPALRALTREVAQMRMELAVMEEERRKADQVDFLAVARLEETRQTVDRECLDSTKNLVDAAAAVMSADQRRRYFQFVQTALPRDPHSGAD